MKKHWLLIGLVVFSVVLAASAVACSDDSNDGGGGTGTPVEGGAPGVQAQEAGATYTGPIDVILGGQCGGGTISLTVSEDGSSISQLVLDGAYAGGFLVNSLSDPAGSPFVVAFDPDIAIGADGSFSLSFPVAGVDTDIEGQFDGDTVSGTDSVPFFDCSNVPFSAGAGAER